MPNSVAYGDNEIDEVVSHADKIIFNSISQLERFADKAAGIARDCGSTLRSVPLASTWPIRRVPSAGSASGTWRRSSASWTGSTASDPQQLREQGFRSLRPDARADWRKGSARSSPRRLGKPRRRHSLHGDDYPIEAFSARLRAFSDRYGVQVYLGAGRSVDYEEARRSK